MSMSMSMGMDVMPAEEMAVEGATGESPASDSDSSTSTVDTETQQDTTPTEETPTVPLQALDGAEDDADAEESSAARVVVGLSGFVGVMGMLLF